MRLRFVAAMPPDAPPVDPIDLLALVDTGASNTVVVRNAISQHGIGPTTTKDILGIGGAVVRADGFFGDLRFDPGGVVACTVFEALMPQKDGIHCLLGRDVLEHAQFVYRGREGRCELLIKGSPVRLEPPRTTL